MMKMKKIVPLMLLLQIAVNPRNISANPIASPGSMGGGVSPSDDGTTIGTVYTEQYMKEGTDILTQVMKWLKDNRPNSSQFDKSVKELKTQMENLPAALARHRPVILDGLFRARDRLNQLRKRLALVAQRLINDCRFVISLYEDNVTSPDKALLKYAAEKFTARAQEVKCILEEALVKSGEIQDILSGTQAVLIDFNAILNKATDDIELKKIDAQAKQPDSTELENKKKYSNIIKLSCTFTPGISCVITSTTIYSEGPGESDDQSKLDTYIAKLNKQLDDIKPSQQAAKTLLGHVKTIKSYLEKEINLIYKWKINLDLTISDHKNFDEEDIRFGIKGIKVNLLDLIEACNNYLNNEIPGILTCPLDNC